MDWLTQLLGSAGGSTLPPTPQVYNPALGAAMIQNPEAVAAAAVQAGVPPPNPAMLNNSQGFDEAGFGGMMDPRPPAAPGAPPVAPVGAPLDIRPPAQVAGMASPSATIAPSTPGATPGSSLAKSLSGLQAPTPPQMQMMRPPDVPGPRGIGQAGQLFALLNAMAQGPQRLPTLGQMIGGR